MKATTLWTFVAVAVSATIGTAALSRADETPGCVQSGVVEAKERMNWLQRKELYVEGTITDCEGKVWRVKILPGTKRTKKIMIQGWRFAGDRTKELFQIETYKDIGEDTKDATKASADFTKKSALYAKEGIWDNLVIDGIKETLVLETAEDWRNGYRDAKSLQGTFGAFAGSIYVGVLKPTVKTIGNLLETLLWHLPKGLLKLIVGTTGAVGGAVAVVSSPVVVPVVEVVGRPALAIGAIATTGTIVPGAMYIWNGLTWTTLQASSVPHKSTLIVRLQHAPEKQMTLDIEAFNTLVQATILETASESEMADVIAALKAERERLEAEIAELQKKLDDLKRQVGETTDEINDVKQAERDRLASIPVMRAYEKLVRELSGSKVRVSDEVQVIELDSAKLRALVAYYVAQLGLTMTPEQLEQAAVAIEKRMAAYAPSSAETDQQVVP